MNERRNCVCLLVAYDVVFVAATVARLPHRNNVHVRSNGLGNIFPSSGGLHLALFDVPVN